MRVAAARIFCPAGSSSPIRTAMMAITTSNSISVNADRPRPMRDGGEDGTMRSLQDLRKDDTQTADCESPGTDRDNALLVSSPQFSSSHTRVPFFLFSLVQ